MTKKKLVIWDLDNTLWDGILSEGDVVLKPGITEIIRALDERGILQSISSRNNFDDACKKLEEFNLLSYFLYPEINWNTKSNSIKNIVGKINISFDTVTFIDDQTFEREEVKFSLPDVTCIDASKINELLEREDMNPYFITEESKIRRLLYQNDIRRNKEEERFDGTKEEFLASLNMVMTIKKAQESDLQRAEELTVRTHQLNSTGYAYSYEELKNIISNDHFSLWVIDLKDKYGYYGKVGLVLIEKEQSAWTLKLLLTSCRVMNRGIGTAMLGLLVNQSLEKQVILRAEFVPNDRNRIMAITYAMMGFQVIQENEGVQVLQYSKETSIKLPEYLEIIAE